MLLDRAELGRSLLPPTLRRPRGLLLRGLCGPARRADGVRTGGGRPREATWRDGLRAAIYAMVDFIGEDAKRTHLMVLDVRGAGDRALDLMHEGYERFFDFLDRGREERAGSGPRSPAPPLKRSEARSSSRCTRPTGRVGRLGACEGAEDDVLGGAALPREGGRGGGAAPPPAIMPAGDERHRTNQRRQ